MINQWEVAIFLEDALPEISGELKLGNNISAYHSISTLTRFTHKNAAAGNYSIVKRSFTIADALHQRGLDY